MTASAYAEFITADQTWFTDHPDRSFRYHVVQPTLAVQLLSGEGSEAEFDPAEPATVPVLAHRTTLPGPGVSHSVLFIPADVLRIAERSYPKDWLGLRLLQSGAPMFPPPVRNMVPDSDSMREVWDHLALP